MTTRESFLTVPDQKIAAPGPGQYDLDILDRVTGGSTLANRSYRFGGIKNEVPGPGSYEVTNSKEWPMLDRAYLAQMIKALSHGVSLLFTRHISPIFMIYL